MRNQIKGYRFSYIFVPLLCVALTVVLFCGTVSAEEQGGLYTLSYTATVDRGNTQWITVKQGLFSSKCPLFLYVTFSKEDSMGFHVGEYVEDTNTCRSVNSTEFTDFVMGSEIIYDKDWEIRNNASYAGNDSLSRFVGFNADDLVSLTTDALVFSSLDAAKAYYVDFDRSGIVKEPEPDYDYDHDFREDVYDPNIPVPELSNLSHNGFTVNNADPSRDIEIYLTSAFYGLKHNSAVHSNENHWPADHQGYFHYDENWVYATNRFNLINTDISYSDSVIDIKEMYKVDNVGALTEDFKRWSREYSSHKKLPDYSFLKYSASSYETNYGLLHNYFTSQGTDDAEKLKLCAQASTTYYVRFCQYEPGKGYTYGQWVSYVYTPAGKYAKDNVTIGDVGVDPSTGEPSVTNPQTGDQNPEDGSFDFNLDLSVGSIADTFFDIINSLIELMKHYSEFGEFLYATFKFIPFHIWALIEAGFGISVVILIYKYVRGM